MPVSTPSSTTKLLGARLTMILHGLVFGVLELPIGGLEELPGLARHDLHILGAEPQR